MKAIHETLGGNRPTTKPNASPELPAMPQTPAEACELFGVAVTDPIHVKPQAVTRVAHLFSRALQLMQE